MYTHRPRSRRRLHHRRGTRTRLHTQRARRTLHRPRPPRRVVIGDPAFRRDVEWFSQCRCALDLGVPRHLDDGHVQADLRELRLDDLCAVRSPRRRCSCRAPRARVSRASRPATRQVPLPLRGRRGADRSTGRRIPASPEAGTGQLRSRPGSRPGRLGAAGRSRRATACLSTGFENTGLLVFSAR